MLSFEAPRRSSNLTPEDSPGSAILKIDKNQMRRQRDRERRNNLSTEQREEINARRRAQYRKHIGQLTADQREERSAERRTLHKNLSPEEEQKHLSMRRASYKTRRMTPCASSIAMSRPDVAASTINKPTMSTSSLTSTCMPNSRIETDGNYHIFTHFYSTVS